MRWASEPGNDKGGLDFGLRDCVVMSESTIKIVIPAQAGIQNVMKYWIPHVKHGQAHRRASLARNDKNSNCGQSLCAGMIIRRIL